MRWIRRAAGRTLVQLSNSDDPDDVRAAELLLARGSAAEANRRWEALVQAALLDEQIDGSRSRAERLVVRTLVAEDDPRRLAVGARIPLPAPSSVYVGDVGAAQALCSRLIAGDSIWVAGPFGSGTTEFALQMLHVDVDTIESTFDAIYWADCDSSADAGQVLSAICQAMGLGETAGQLPATMAELAKTDRSLLILDGIARVSARDGRALYSVLRRIPVSAQLVVVGDRPPTSQFRHWVTHEVQPLTMAQSTELFEAVTGAKLQNQALRRNIDDLTGGLPALVHLIVRKVRTLGGPDAFQRVYNRAGARGLELESGTRLSWALEHSSPVQSSLPSLAVLASLPAGLPMDTLNEALGLNPYVVGELTQVGVVTRRFPAVAVQDRSATANVRVLQLLNEEIAARASTTAVERIVTERLLPFLVNRLIGLERHLQPAVGTDVTQPLLQFRSELPNYLALLPSFAAHASDAPTTAAIGALARWMARCGGDAEASVLTPVLDEGDISSAALRELTFAAGDVEMARQRFEPARVKFRNVAATSTDSLTNANALKRQADAYFCMSNLSAAFELYGLARQAYDSVGSSLGRANCDQCIGELHLRKGQLESARRYLDEGLETYRTLSDNLGVANCELLKGEVDVSRFRVGLAAARAESVQRRYSDLGVPTGLLSTRLRATELGSVALRSDPRSRLNPFGDMADLIRTDTSLSLLRAHAFELAATGRALSHDRGALRDAQRAFEEYASCGDTLGMGWATLTCVVSGIVLNEPPPVEFVRRLEDPSLFGHEEWADWRGICAQRSALDLVGTAKRRIPPLRLDLLSRGEIAIQHRAPEKRPQLLLRIPRTRSFITYTKLPLSERVYGEASNE